MKIFERFNQRELLILMLGSVVMIGLTIHSFIIEPYNDRYSRVAEKVSLAKTDLGWIADAASQISRSMIVRETGSFTGSLANKLNQIVQSLGLKSYLAQMTPVGDNEVRIRFSKLEFSHFLRLIAVCRDSNIKIVDFRIDVTAQKSIVDASIVLAR
ncbi:MAG: type II secretory pathway component PulM [Gammaproteobacteria bacterium]|jgi:type II secretory pathway component PulM